MRFRVMFTSALLVSLSIISGQGAEPTEVAQSSDLERLHALIKPKPEEEKWMRVPWLTSLWEARKKAAAEGKPILLWEMDGHPLGCT